MKRILLVIMLMVICGCGSRNSGSASLGAETFIEIKNESDLKQIGANLNANYRLANDIALVGKWEPLGNAESPFKGEFDGQGFKISGLEVVDNLNISIETKSSGKKEYLVYAGLFGFNSGKIANLELVDVNIGVAINEIQNANDDKDELKIFVGGVAGQNDGIIQDCYVEGDIDLKSTVVISRGRAGLLVGKNDNIISNCSSEGQVTSMVIGANIRAGGLIGACENGIVLKSFSTANVDISNINDRAMGGGLIGLAEVSKITDCYATGTVNVISARSAAAGGLIGYIDATIEGISEVTNSYSSGIITSEALEKSSYAGGVIGDIVVDLALNLKSLIGDVKITGCFFMGTIHAKAENKAYVGGIIGDIEGETVALKITGVSNCAFVNKNITSDGVSGVKHSSLGSKLDTLEELLATLIHLDENIWVVNQTELPTLI